MTTIPDSLKVLVDKSTGQRYIKGKLLGTGGFAKCFEVTSQETGELLAAKVISKKSVREKKQRFKLLLEIKIHRQLKHKHIVEFITAFEDQDSIYILLEYCRNYTLKDLVKRRKRLTEFEARAYVGQVVKALLYIHSQGFIHRDLKLGNILINDRMEAKICDFGLSTRVKMEGEKKETICGTPNYIAPEILYEHGHSYEVDIWSIGVIMYTLLFGKPPFEDSSVEETYKNIKNNRYSFPSQIRVSDAAKDLISRILVNDPARRLTLQQILQHRFVQTTQDLSFELPLSSLAVPPYELDQASMQKLLIDFDASPAREHNRLQFEQCESQIAQNYPVHSSEDLDVFVAYKFLFVLEAFMHKGLLGYLLSNGVMGVYDCNVDQNIQTEYGTQNYVLFKGLKTVQRGKTELELDSIEMLQALMHFRAYFILRYPLYKLDDLHKRSTPTEEPVLVRRCALTNRDQNEILLRLNTGLVQLCMPELFSLMINSEFGEQIYICTKSGKLSTVNYDNCPSSQLKKKIRRFSNIIRVASGDGS